MSVESSWMKLMHRVEDFLAIDGGLAPEHASALGASALAAAEHEQNSESYLYFSAAMAHQAIVEKFGVEPTDVGLVESNDAQGNKQLVVMYTGAEGLKQASQYALTGEDRNDVFSVEFETEPGVTTTADTRQGMTWQVYRDFVAARQQEGADLPDQNGTVTVLTGEPVTGAGKDLAATVGRMRSRPATPYRDYAWRVSEDALRFRPAVVIGTVPEEEAVAKVEQQEEANFYFSVEGKNYVAVPVGGQVFFASLGRTAVDFAGDFSGPGRTIADYLERNDR